MKAAESTVLRVLQGSKVFLVPNFQRRYSWRAKEWHVLWNDLLREYHVHHGSEAQNPDGHFLGSIVLHPAGGPASVLMRHLVVDGQQRLTTIIVLLAAIRDVRSELDPTWNPGEYNDKYLMNPYDSDYPDRLRPTEPDRDAYVRTVREHIPTDGIGQAYTFFIKRIRSAAESGEVDVVKLGNTLLLHMILVEITTATGDSVNNIFNTLNSRGKPLTSADLVRNELLLQIGDDASSDAYRKYWTPMETALVNEGPTGFDDRQFVTFLWSREVAWDPTVTRQDLFSAFERRFRSALGHLSTNRRRDAALDTLAEIHADHILFLFTREPLSPEFDALGFAPELRRSFERLRRWGSEPTTPLALWIAKHVWLGEVSQLDATASVDTLLGYLLRRALAGIPTNLLNRLLTPIPSRLAQSAGSDVHRTIKSILVQKGYYWPSDRDVLNAVLTQSLFISAKRQVPFILELIEESMGDGQAVDGEFFSAVHVMPQPLSVEWLQDLRDAGVDIDDALSASETLGNLTLARGVNESENDNFFTWRRQLAGAGLRLNDSLLALDRFLPQDIRARTRHFAELLLRRFPKAADDSGAGYAVSLAGSSESDRLEAALQAIPEGAWTTEGDLVVYLGSELQGVRSLVNQLDPVVARLVRTASGAIPPWLNEGLRAEVLLQSTDLSAAGPLDAEALGDLVREVEDVADDTFADADDVNDFESEV
ncbi:DUF262 domain-containing protein [Microbacterium timonense]|uniref:DUF262 domain-containing protein n=1 Tax=Microbacterium timonense TaxID=2086576 RepID=UPI000D0F6659|nr:DUF262 domain-containing protein [Microbacterium timonense]